MSFDARQVDAPRVDSSRRGRRRRRPRLGTLGTLRIVRRRFDGDLVRRHEHLVRQHPHRLGVVETRRPVHRPVTSSDFLHSWPWPAVGMATHACACANSSFVNPVRSFPNSTATFPRLASSANIFAATRR